MSAPRHVGFETSRALMSSSAIARLRAVCASALVRVRRDQRIVYWPRPVMRFGNLLYLWLQADIQQRAGRDARVLLVDGFRGWEDAFPEAFGALCLAPEAVRFLDRRELGTFQGFGTHYGADDMTHFVRRYLLPSPGLTGFRAVAEQGGLVGASTIVVNVRRGDYYSVPEYRERYGFDVRGYCLAAVREQLEWRHAERVMFISDDVEWCLEGLGDEVGRLGLAVDAQADRDPQRDFASLCWSDRLILANSTFSYWGGYVSTVRAGESGLVVAPWFHARDWLGGKSFHLHPRWRIIEGFHDAEDGY